MLNIFYWYGVIWTFVVILYNLGWSRYNTQLNPSLFIFLVLSIAISFILGYLLREKFTYRELRTQKLSSGKISTTLIVLTTIADFIYAKQIPLIGILTGRSTYGNFVVIPLIHTLLENFIIFNCSIRTYSYLETKKKIYLIEVVIGISSFLLMFHKGASIFCFFIIANLAIAKLRAEHKRILTFRRGFLLCFTIFIILYINGGLANLRTGYSWNDNYFISHIGGVDSWPTFIPNQLCWTYVYITSPLANLNLTIKKYEDAFNFYLLLISFLPVFISKRFFPNWRIKGGEGVLHISALNASTGFFEEAIVGGVFGIWLFFVMFTTLILIVFGIMEKKNIFNRSALYAILSMQFAFLFFYNTLTTAALSFLIIYMLCYVYVSRIRFKISQNQNSST